MLSRIVSGVNGHHGANALQTHVERVEILNAPGQSSENITLCNVLNHDISKDVGLTENNINLLQYKCAVIYIKTVVQ